MRYPTVDVSASRRALDLRFGDCFTHRALPLLLATVGATQSPLAPPRELQRVGEFTVGEGNTTKLLAYSGDGHTLAALSQSEELVVFALDTGKVTARRIMHSQTSALALSPDVRDLGWQAHGASRQYQTAWKRACCLVARRQPNRRHFFGCLPHP